MAFNEPHSVHVSESTIAAVYEAAREGDKAGLSHHSASGGRHEASVAQLARHMGCLQDRASHSAGIWSSGIRADQGIGVVTGSVSGRRRVLGFR